MLRSALTAMIASVTVNGTWTFVHVSPPFPKQSCHVGKQLLGCCSLPSLTVTEKSAFILPYLSAKQLIMSVSQPLQAGLVYKGWFSPEFIMAFTYKYV